MSMLIEFQCTKMKKIILCNLSSENSHCIILKWKFILIADSRQIIYCIRHCFSTTMQTTTLFFYPLHEADGAKIS